MDEISIPLVDALPTTESPQYICWPMLSKVSVIGPLQVLCL